MKEVVFKTYNEWFQVNRHVRKGEKSSMRNKDDVALFSEEQTDVNIASLPRYYDPSGKYEPYMTDDYEDSLTAFDIGADFKHYA